MTFKRLSAMPVTVTDCWEWCLLIHLSVWEISPKHAHC